jgi:hypothetical protein
MQQEPQREHQWLQALVGEWTYESDCDMGPDKPRERVTGSEVVRAFGDLWTVAEGEGGGPEGGWKSIMTLGYDPAKKKFVGTFVATIMPNLWVYEGSLDAAGKVLTLDAEGPNFTDGRIVKYHDIITITDDGRRTLSSEVLGDDGKWTTFMTAYYQRKAMAAAR